jgi:hypothetical protein
MTAKLMNWAIFGVTTVLWVHAYTWASSEGHGSTTTGLIMISLITMSLLNGKTSGDNGIGHVIAGLKGCMNLVIGWIVLSVVHNVLAGLIYTHSVDPMFVVNGVVDTLAIVVASIIAFSALNAVRD